MRLRKLNLLLLLMRGRREDRIEGSKGGKGDGWWKVKMEDKGQSEEDE